MQTSTLTPDRQTFRALVAEIAAKAKEKLPQAVNGRIESAVKLVLAYDVTPQADGTILVGSSSDPIKTYRLVGTTCECQDFQYGKAPEGWCSHRIAAGIAKRVQELLPPAPEPEPAATVAATAVSAVPTPSPLPEAPASANVRLQIGGREVQITLRDTSEDRLIERLERVLARYPQPQPPAQPATQGPLSPQQHNAAAMHRPVSDFCPIHQVAMKWNEGKDGRKGWHSHRTAEGQWCKGR
jgi:hypothetical protein